MVVDYTDDAFIVKNSWDAENGGKVLGTHNLKGIPHPCQGMSWGCQQFNQSTDQKTACLQGGNAACHDKCAALNSLYAYVDNCAAFYESECPVTAGH